MKHNKGFSLVELLVSIAILSIIMVMVVQFMGTASVSLRRTRKQMDLQTGAMEFREQLSDVMMQATYIRIETKDTTGYVLETDLETSNINKKRKRVLEYSSIPDTNKVDLVDPSLGLSMLTLVSDGYPNYCKAGSKDLDIYIDKNDYTLLGKDGAIQYPSTVDDSIRSFRLLTNGTVSGNSYYIRPEYIYIRYQPTYQYDATGGTTDNTITAEKYVIYHITDDNKVYVYKDDVANPDTATDDGFVTAKGKIATDTGENSSLDIYTGLMVDLVKEFYMSVDTEANTVMVEAQLYDTEQPKSQRGTDDSAYRKYIYDYEDSIALRNSHALTVAPNKLYKREVITVTPTPTPTP